MRNTTTTLTGSPAKLPSGSWGVRIHRDGSSIRPGQQVKVTTRAGKSWVATISEIVSDGGRDAIVATQGGNRSQPRRRYPRQTRRSVDCSYCDSMGRSRCIGGSACDW